MAGVGGGITKRKYEPPMNADKRGWNTKRTLGGKKRSFTKRSVRGLPPLSLGCLQNEVNDGVLVGFRILQNELGRFTKRNFLLQNELGSDCGGVDRRNRLSAPLVKVTHELGRSGGHDLFLRRHGLT